MQKIAFFLLTISLFAESQSSPTTFSPTSGKYSHNPSYSPVHDVMKVLPISKILEVEATHLKNDDGFKAAVLYFQGQEWTQLVNTVLKSVEFKKFAEMTLKYKFNISQAISCMRKHIESLKVVPTKVTSKPDLEPFVADIRNALPLGEIAKMLTNTDNPEVIRIRQEIASVENQKIAQNLHYLPDMVKMRAILRGMNFDVEPYLTLVYSFLGWM